MNLKEFLKISLSQIAKEEVQLALADMDIPLNTPIPYEAVIQLMEISVQRGYIRAMEDTDKPLN